MSDEKQVVNIIKYEKPGTQNTDHLIEISANYLLMHRDITKVAVASTTGYTAIKTVRTFERMNINNEILVCYQDMNDEWKMDEYIRSQLVNAGIKMVEIPKRYLSSKISSDAVSLMRSVSQGAKVCFEMLTFLKSTQMLGSGDKVLAIAGTLHGADTAMIFKVEQQAQFVNILAFPNH